MANPEILLTEAWLGIRKKYTAAEITATAAVNTSISINHPACFACFF